MEIEAAISKIDRYASSEQGNKVEILERPNGGISVIMAEGRLHGKRSKALAMKAVHNVLSLIAEGINDGASARVVLNQIKNEHIEKALVNITIISCDLQSGTIVITKNNSIPVLVYENGKSRFLPLDASLESDPFDSVVYQFEFKPDETFILISQGIQSSGNHTDNPIDLTTAVDSIYDDDEEPNVQKVADTLLKQAIAFDGGRPRDDMTVIVLKVSPISTKDIRREYICFPITNEFSISQER